MAEQVCNCCCCCMCGDVGLAQHLFRCLECGHRYQHTYCSRLYPNRLEPALCNWCLVPLMKTDQTPPVREGEPNKAVLEQGNILAESSSPLGGKPVLQIKKHTTAFEYLLQIADDIQSHQILASPPHNRTAPARDQEGRNMDLDVIKSRVRNSETDNIDSGRPSNLLQQAYCFAGGVRRSREHSAHRHYEQDAVPSTMPQAHGGGASAAAEYERVQSCEAGLSKRLRMVGAPGASQNNIRAEQHGGVRQHHIVAADLYQKSKKASADSAHAGGGGGLMGRQGVQERCIWRTTSGGGQRTSILRSADHHIIEEQQSHILSSSPSSRAGGAINRRYKLLADVLCL